jgi:hypothetical protein
MITCGDLGNGKACEWLGKNECERHCGRPCGRYTQLCWSSYPACASMLVLVETRMERDRMKCAVEFLACQLAMRSQNCSAGNTKESWIEIALRQYT